MALDNTPTAWYEHSQLQIGEEHIQGKGKNIDGALPNTENRLMMMMIRKSANCLAQKEDMQRLQQGNERLEGGSKYSHPLML